MNKPELISTIAEKSNLTKKDAECALNALLDTITETMVKGDKVKLIGFGTFEVKERAPRIGRNPRTNAKIVISKSKTPSLNFSKVIREAVR